MRTIFNLLIFTLVFISPFNTVFAIDSLNIESDPRLQMAKEYIISLESENACLEEEGRYDELHTIYDLRASINNDPFISNSYNSELSEAIGRYHEQLQQNSTFSNAKIRLILDMYVTEDTVTRSDNYVNTENYCKGYLRQLIADANLGNDYLVIYIGSVIDKNNKQYTVLIPAISAHLKNTISADKLSAYQQKLQYAYSTYQSSFISADSSSEELLEARVNFTEANEKFASDAVAPIALLTGEAFTNNTYTFVYKLSSKGILARTISQVSSPTNILNIEFWAQPQEFIAAHKSGVSLPEDYYRFPSVYNNTQSACGGNPSTNSKVDEYAKLIALSIYREAIGNQFIPIASSTDSIPGDVVIYDFRNIFNGRGGVNWPSFNSPIIGCYLNQCIQLPNEFPTISNKRYLLITNTSNATGSCESQQPVASSGQSSSTQSPLTSTECSYRINNLKAAINRGSGSEILAILEGMKQPVQVAQIHSSGSAPIISSQQQATWEYQRTLTECLQVTDRVAAIKHLCNVAYVTERYERVILNLITSTPANQRPPFIQLIQEQGILALLLDKMHDEGIGASNLTRCIDAIDSFVYSNWGSQLSVSVERRFFRWRDDENYRIDYSADFIDGKVNFQYTEVKLIPDGDNRGGAIEYGRNSGSFNQVSPYSCIAIRLESIDPDMFTPGTVVSPDGVLLMSALRFYYIIHKKFVKKVRLLISVSTNVALFAVGAGELIAAVRAAQYLRITLAVIDLIQLPIGAIIEERRDVLQQTPEGRLVLASWTTFNTAYAGAILTPVAVSYGKNLVTSYNQYRRLYASNLLHSLDEKINILRAELIDNGIQFTVNVYSDFNTLPNLRSYLSQLQSRLQNHTLYYRIEREIRLLPANEISILENNPALLNSLNTNELVNSTDEVLSAAVRGRATYNTGNILQNLSGTLEIQYNKLITTGLHVAQEGNITKLLNAENKLIAEIINNKLVFKYNGFGGDIVMTEGRTTTVFGRFNDPIHGAGTKEFIQNSPKVFETGSNPNGMNILNLSDWTWSKNEAWVIESANRGDIIRFISDPTNPRNIFKNGIGGERTVTGLEVQTLENLGYVWDASKFQFIKQ